MLVNVYKCLRCGEEVKLNGNSTLLHECKSLKNKEGCGKVYGNAKKIKIFEVNDKDNESSEESPKK